MYQLNKSTVITWCINIAKSLFCDKAECFYFYRMITIVLLFREKYHENALGILFTCGSYIFSPFFFLAHG